MTTMIVTTPIRPIPDNYPPVGSLCLVNYLRRHDGGDVEFFNIDQRRPTYEEALARIIATRPRVLGISAVVSTAYEYTKRLSLDVKRSLPDCLIVVGGNLAASAEILLRYSGTDICVLGEGEKVFLNIVRRSRDTTNPDDFLDIPGLALVDGNDHLVNTGYETPLDKSEIYDIDWADLEASSDINHFIYDAFANDGPDQFFRQDKRTYEPHRSGKKMSTLVASKGCVARCTFCHRWDKGIRYIPVEVLMQRIDHLIERYDVGFINFGDENFGTDRRWLSEFCEQITQRDVIWAVRGMRVNCINTDLIAMMKAAGCVAIICGMESGSEKMLEIMEKKVKLQDNYDAMRMLVEQDMFTAIQLVLGMPGENNETIRETVRFCKESLTLHPEQDPNDLSINYAQALPGTPLYEYGRHNGLIGQHPDDEEQYLVSISDRNAHDETVTLNFTDQPKLRCETWRPLIQIEVSYAYFKAFGAEHYRSRILGNNKLFASAEDDKGYFANPRRLVRKGGLTDTVNDIRETYVIEGGEDIPSLLTLIRKRRFGHALICYPRVAYHFRKFLIMLVIWKNVSRNGLPYTLALIWEDLAQVIKNSALGRRFAHQYVSLRKITDLELGNLPSDAAAGIPLRKGR